jgi:ArsR family transcriptional regulator, arsenate/arsenite/antimonite-responsive transcriptional repressor / arsenate reductase (thioredoxin)
VSLTGQAPNLVSYHLAQLRGAGLVSVRRSSADGRDSYYALDLDAVRDALGRTAHRIHPGFAWSPETEPPGPSRALRVLFICTANSSRSQMAEGWLRHLGGPQVVARSAGIAPTSLHPLAVAAMREGGVDIAGQQVKHVGAVADQIFDRVITLCDRAREACPELAPTVSVAHWSIPNPADAHPPDLDAFRSTARELETRVRYLLALSSEPQEAAVGRRAFPAFPR